MGVYVVISATRMAVIIYYAMEQPRRFVVLTKEILQIEALQMSDFKALGIRPVVALALQSPEHYTRLRPVTYKYMRGFY